MRCTVDALLHFPAATRAARQRTSYHLVRTARTHSMDAGGGDMMPLRPPPFLRLYEGVDVPPPTHSDIAAAALAPAAVGAAAGPLLPPLRPDEMARRQGMSDTATYCVFGEFHPIIPQFVTNLKHTHIPQLYAEAAFQVQPPGADDAGSSAPKVSVVRSLSPRVRACAHAHTGAPPWRAAPDDVFVCTFF
ncbi:hypothetical protein EON67_05100 [archaeon]|nr:MAG: hypothetical protein EON67_05100 [archaeon]